MSRWRTTDGSVDVDQLAELLKDAWRCQAPRKLVKASGI
jgi:hypothetical protein